MRVAAVLLLGTLGFFGCSADADPAVQGDDANQTAGTTIALTADFKTAVKGTLSAGVPVRVEYALERLPTCRGNVGNGGPGWNITGFFSENGGDPKPFEVTALSPDGKDRVAAPATITPSRGGDLAMWFQVGSRWGCQAFDSQFGQNFHFSVKGAPPEADATLVFKADGAVDRSGALHAGGKVKVRYEQDRLPQCRRTNMGNPVWSITGNAQIDGEPAHTFDTGRAQNGDRVPVDAIIDLPHSGELSLWFQVVSLGGCIQYDSKNGANYRFHID